MKLTKEKVCLWTFSEGILKHKTTLVESLTGLLSDTGSTPVISTNRLRERDNKFIFIISFLFVIYIKEFNVERYLEFLLIMEILHCVQ